ncbi:MAG: O-antigen ligase family protein, partial [Chloroflexi bacterium]|nr:O-antigen ligase family protein [Chloroflexota bacterium]
MPTKISRYCEGILEAAWLAAIILTPLFFNIYSSRIFEPDKLTLLRSLALVILAAWLIKAFDEGGVRWDKLQPGKSPFKFIINFPLVAPAAATAVLYLISTLFSITARTSFFGSYQRLQGTYTTLSYLVIFLSVIANLRRREQLERLLTMAILTSLPIALYGVLQRYKIDPVPWGGDTSLRIAANMGNSIFVAAYLIMVIPLTIGRMVQSFAAILRDEENMWPQVARATVYVFIGALQVIALYMSGSRGPALGWMAGTFFLFLLLSLLWRKRWLTLSIVGAALALGAFLVVFNLEGGPLENLRKSPAIGRFGLLLNPESNSALVRKYIWEGAADLVAPHEPLSYPDGRTDAFNILRPLIGYGPESMYVAYNPFYVPELAIVERRNASPDRSHNETWDALVITGALGILVYLSVFTLVFYYGLKWIGLIEGSRQRNLYLGLWLGSGAIGAVGMGLWRGVEYFGVGLPFGMLIGLLAYLTLAAIFGQYRATPTAGERGRSLTLIVLIAAIVSHFVEINFGIAIASTRTYFWMYAGLLVCAGAILPLYGEYGAAQAAHPRTGVVAEEKKGGQRSVKKKARARSGEHESAGWLEEYRPALAAGMLAALVLITLGFDFIANPRGIKSGLEVLWGMLTRLPNQGNVISFGVLSMMLTTWIAMAIALTAEEGGHAGSSWLKRLGLALAVSLAVTLVYWLWQAGTLAFMARQSATDMQKVMEQVGRYASLLSRYYFIILLALLLLARTLLPPAGRLASTPVVGYFVAPVVALLAGLIIVFTNLRVIQADITFKIAEPFSRNGNWPAAIAIYNRANELAPQEDY